MSCCKITDIKLRFYVEIHQLTTIFFKLGFTPYKAISLDGTLQEISLEGT